MAAVVPASFTRLVTSAKARNVQLSPQKGRLVADLIRGLPVEEALLCLQFSRQKAGRLIAKVLNSAIANAEENHKADIDALCVRRIEVSDGMCLKRVHFSARGRISRIDRRHSHILLELGEIRSLRRGSKGN